MPQHQLYLKKAGTKMQKGSTSFWNTYKPFQALEILQCEAIPPLVCMSASMIHTAF